ncbi:MAG: DUF4180 domain-containing protein [Clostridium sp.]|uniref:DUF4180 domain-containing protein n=1 Tax=Clostridium sp. TaxID=1506 RepID=UPI0025BCD43C|nr:DUF4180 domain-containing protein [Clostridium sp.]MCF0149080.1 DUF4180 domain-containing protein [Clostridium sp.]
MKYKVINKDDKSYILFDENKICSEEEIIDVISAIFSENTSLVVIDKNVLSEEFYDLKTKLLGMALQKFINYHVKVAFIIEEDRVLSDRFKELILEINKGNNFRACNSIVDAENWLLG